MPAAAVAAAAQTKMAAGINSGGLVVVKWRVMAW